MHPSWFIITHTLNSWTNGSRAALNVPLTYHVLALRSSSCCSSEAKTRYLSPSTHTCISLLNFTFGGMWSSVAEIWISEYALCDLSWYQWYFALETTNLYGNFLVTQILGLPLYIYIYIYIYIYLEMIVHLRRWYRCLKIQVHNKVLFQLAVSLLSCWCVTYTTTLTIFSLHNSGLKISQKHPVKITSLTDCDDDALHNII